MAKFKTRARTLDMLGRQQIAGIPTAVSELFKNAHDAYADRVEIDYYRSDGLFVLRDDGLGMTKEDFLNRWLSIGTESKIKSSSMQPAPKDPNKKERPMLGEKGIGRLAIAKIGPQVLILSRARREEGLSQLTAAFINWSMFEYPGINLEDVEVPVKTFRGGKLPTKKDILDMVVEFGKRIGKLESAIDADSIGRVRSELEEFNVDPIEIDSYLGSPTLTGEGSGTHFIIKPSSDLLPLDIDGTKEVDRATPLKKALLGFTNTMVPRESEPVIKVTFRDHKSDEISEDLLAEEEFFTLDEFENADHQIEGEFDAFGQFTGTVRIYGEEIKNHIIPWTGNADNQSECGSFKIRFAAIEGEYRHSTLPPEEHTRISKKTGLIGGLYIYRDGIRILPYGDTDYDWLDIEYRRTKSASYYYFSHRKMFGAVEIGAENNHRLHEKAGREGFQENKAYRQFKSILRNFFQQIAADFFRKEGTFSERFEQRKKELGKQELDRRKREQLVSEKRKMLSNNMDEIFVKIENEAPHNEVLELSERVTSNLDKVRNIADPNQAASMIIEIETTARTQLQEIESKYKLQRPRIALSKAMDKNWQDYTAAYDQLVNDVFRPAREIIEDIVKESSSKANVEVNRRSRIQNSLNDLADRARKDIRALGAETNRTMNTLSNQVREITKDCMQTVEMELRSIIVDFQHVDLSEYSDKELSVLWGSLEERISKTAEQGTDRIKAISSLFDLVDFNDKTSVVDQLVAIEQRNLWLEEEVENDLQLAQLGMAIEVINHEFSATIRSIRNSLKRLKAWADLNNELAPLHERIRANFDHLDGYLTLFTPLHRRLYRKEISIKGSDVYEFLQDLFQERLARHHVDLAQTKAFSSSIITGYPSSFYPVFVNLVDNAIFWLSEQNPSEERRIELDEDNGSWIISDTGPGINQVDRESIFEFGFTRKPNGRGMGLHISREVLRRVGYTLDLSPSSGLKGASFTISVTSKDT